MKLDFNQEKIRIRSTLLRAASRNIAEAEWMLFGGSTPQTESMLLGSAAHCMLLEPECFSERYKIYNGTKIGKEYKEINQDRMIPIPKKMHTKVVEMTNTMNFFLSSKYCIEPVKKIMRDGIKEQDLFLDKKNFKLTIKPDAYDSDYFLDYKTTAFPSLTNFQWEEHCIERGLDIQLGFYYYVLNKLQKTVTKGAYHLLQSTVPPYCIKVFFFPRKILESLEPKVGINMARIENLVADLYEVSKIEFIDLDNFDFGSGLQLSQPYNDNKRSYAR